MKIAMKGLLLITCILLFQLSKLNSQSYNYQHYDLSSGLSGLTVYKIVQDNKGFIWFATETGLSRFDGTSFKNFSTEDGLPDNEVLDLFLDSEDRLWILPFTNSICYYKEGKIHNSKNDSLLSRIQLTTPPVTITQNQHGDLLILSNYSLTLINRLGKIKTFNQINDHTFTNYGIVKNSTKSFFLPIGTGNHHSTIFMVEINGDSLGVKQSLPFLDYSTTTKSNSIYRPNMLILRQKKFFKLDFGQNKSTKVDVPDHFVSLSLLSDSLIALNCSNKVITYNFKSNTFEDTFLLNKIVTYSFIDTEGSYWFATNGYGVYKLSSKAFRNYSFVYDRNSLPVYSIFKLTDQLLIGTNAGLVWKIDNNKDKPVILEKNEELDESRITALLLDKNKLFIGSGSPALTEVSKNKKTIVLNKTSLKSITKEDSNILISTNIGAFIVNVNNNIITDTLFRFNRTTCGIKFKDNYYLGTLNGLYWLAVNKKDSGYLKHKELNSSRISALVKTNNSLWIATYGNGIIEFSDGKILNHYTQKNGLTSNMCRDISIDRNWLWIGTDKGLNKINLSDSNRKIISYTTKDGLNNELINKVVAVNDSVFIGTADGLIFFRPKDVNNYSISNLYIETIKSRKNTWSFDSTLNFAANDNRFYVEYGAISFKSNGNITFHYRLNGLDSSWKETKERFIDYASLSPGDYQFQLYAINAFGKKSNELKINFSIDSYFYQKAWFIILVLLSAGSIIWYFVSRRIRKIKAEETAKLKTQKRLTELEQLAFRAQMNPHFIFNCLNSIQQYIFTKSALEANKFITDFSSLIRQTLDLSAKKYISLAEEIKYISTYLSLEHTRFDKSFNYSIKLANQLNAEEVFLPPLLMQPFVENAIRHGVRNLKETDGLITVDFSAEGDFLVYTLSDNGIGIEGSLKLRGKNIIEHQSKGMTLIQKRIEALNEELSKKIELRISYVDEIHKKGTKIILRLPLYI